jgi:hypothetical protein
MAAVNPNQKLVDRTREQIAEIKKCGTDPVYFIKKYVKVSHPLKGVVPFELYPFQEDCIRAFKKHRFNVALKSRQIGITTVTAAHVVWMCMFQKDRNVLIIATKLNTALGFINKCKLALDNIPQWLMLSKYVPTTQCIKFSNGSKITAVPTSEDAGRSEAITFLIVDEAAFVKNFDKMWNTNLKPTLSTGGGAIVLSSPNGVGNQFHKMYIEAEAGLNGFNPVRLPWHVHPEHDQAWFDNETKGMNRQDIAQEYECAFLSGGGNMFLTPEVLDKLQDDIRHPLEKTGHQNCVWVWQKPRPDAKYVMSADVSRGDSKDFSAFHVIDVAMMNVVAEFVGKIAPDDFGVLLDEWGKKYNTALIVPENNTFGFMTFTKLKKDMKYPRIYYESMKHDPFAINERKNSDDDEDNDSEIGGINTNASNRNVMLATLEEYIRTCRLISPSQRLFDQFQTFIWNGKKAQAAKDSYDDAIMSLAIGCFIVSTLKEAKKETGTMMQTLMRAVTSSRTSVDKISKSPIEYMPQNFIVMMSNLMPRGGVGGVKTGESHVGKMMKEAQKSQENANRYRQNLGWLLR